MAPEGKLGMDKDQVLKRSHFRANREQRIRDLAIHFQKQIQQNEEVQTHPLIQGNQLRHVNGLINVFCINRITLL